jgi:hypothetical protein
VRNEQTDPLLQALRVAMEQPLMAMKEAWRIHAARQLVAGHSVSPSSA